MTKIVPAVRVSMREQPEAEPGIRHDRHRELAVQALEEDRDPEGLDDGEQDRAVARVLGDLLAAFLAFLLQLLEVRDRPRRRAAG